MASITDITRLSITQAATMLNNHEITSVDLVSAYISVAKSKQHLNAFVLLTEELALQQAAASDIRRKNNATHGILDGIPIAVKDLFCTKGIRTTACSNILRNFIPEYESTVTSKLWNSGAVCIGKTNMDEFAMGSSTTYGCFGPTINPWRRMHDPEAQLSVGGSSGGSAAAVAGYMCSGGIGSDTGGSVRQPSALCGIVGVKPTYGRCSRYGMIAFCSSLDQAGVFGRSVKDTAIMLEVISGYDENDQTTSKIAPIPDFISFIGKDVSGMVIGIPEEYRSDELPIDVLEMWDMAAQYLRDAGAYIVDIKLPMTEYALPTYYVIAPAEASSNLARYDGVRYGHRAISESGDKITFEEMVKKTRTEGFGVEVKRRIAIGTYTLSAKAYGEYYLRAQKVRRLIADDFARAFSMVDAILVPTTTGPAFMIGDHENDPVQMYYNDVFTVPISLASLPSISVPCGVDKKYGLPLGMQIICKPYHEGDMFCLASALETKVKQAMIMPQLPQ